MKKSIFLLALLIVSVVIIFSFIRTRNIIIDLESETPRTWDVKSIDTMKYSRDLAGEKLNDQAFNETIDRQVKAIYHTGVTHIAIATPYDEKYIPYLARWVDFARAYNLKVWFRGNFAGWEGWFGYKKNLTRDQHLVLMREFINHNGELFRNGDLFTPCPECEHGGPGDPRRSGDIDGFRKFMIAEFQASNAEFRLIGKNVRTVTSMNYDVADLVMDEQTANAVGNLVVIDHYVSEPAKFVKDVEKLSEKAQAPILIGEFGVPIPDIHGSLNEEEQAKWLDELLNQLRNSTEVIGLNYWVSYGGSTAIFNNDDSAKPAAETLKKYYNLQELSNL